MREHAHGMRYQIAQDKGFLSWSFLKLGYERHLIGRAQVIGYAVEVVSQESRVPDPVLELAGADEYSDQEIADLLGRISPKAENSERDLDRWRLCVLVQIRATCTDDEELLAAVSDVYSMFDYPPDLSRAIPYMPVERTAGAKIGDILESPVAALDNAIRDLGLRVSQAAN